MISYGSEEDSILRTKWVVGVDVYTISLNQSIIAIRESCTVLDIITIRVSVIPHCTASR